MGGEGGTKAKTSERDVSDGELQAANQRPERSMSNPHSKRQTLDIHSTASSGIPSPFMYARISSAMTGKTASNLAREAFLSLGVEAEDMELDGGCWEKLKEQVVMGEGHEGLVMGNEGKDG